MIARWQDLLALDLIGLTPTTRDGSPAGLHGLPALPCRLVHYITGPGLGCRGLPTALGPTCFDRQKRGIHNNKYVNKIYRCTNVIEQVYKQNL